MNAVTLTVQDDQDLYEVAVALGNIAEAIRVGDNVEGLADLLNFAGMQIARVMAEAYERANPEFGF